jgi:PEP-CTERM motif-containing protein
MRVVLQFCVVPALLAGLALVPRMASAQAGLESDFLGEFVRDQNPQIPPPILPGVPLVPPAVSYTIGEGSAAEAPQVFAFPGREIDFQDPSPLAVLISDRLSITPYQVSVQSDNNPDGLPRRADAVLIPRSALERFAPFSILAHSDGNVPGTVALESDHLTISLGYHGPGTGTTDFNGTIVEPPQEGLPEDFLTHTIAPVHFDVEQPLAETGGKAGVISDYVDILTPIQVTLISSDNPSVFANLPPAQGFVFENNLTGGGVRYSLGFASDAVPEPASFILLGTGLLSLGLIGRRRFLGSGGSGRTV